jgi:hypothetical protein
MPFDQITDLAERIASLWGQRRKSGSRHGKLAESTDRIGPLHLPLAFPFFPRAALCERTLTLRFSGAREHPV